MVVLLARLAWRNVLRNRRRTLLSGLAVGLGLASLMFVSALMAGMFESMISTVTDTFLGQGQIHAGGFRDTLEVENTIKDPGGVLQGLAGEPLLEEFAPRTVSFGMLSSASGVQQVLLYGIRPGAEMKITLVDDVILMGEYLAGHDSRGILIGAKAAETLGAAPGDRLVLTVAQARTGALSQDMFRVRGVFRTGIREMDSGMAFIDIDKARELLALGEGMHEIALRFKDLRHAGDTGLPFWRKYSADGNEALGWRDLVPQLDSAIELSRMSKAITLFLVFAIVALTIMNTLFMSLHERIFEFGVLRALGTRPLRMAAVIMLEAAFLASISIVIGTGLGFAATEYFSYRGIDYRGIEFAGVTITELLYPVVELEQFTLYPLLIFLFSLVSALYPAAYAAGLSPARAMRKSM